MTINPNAMKLIPVVVFFLAAALFSSCGKSERQLAAEKLQAAQLLYQQGDTAQALLQADSIRLVYKTAIQEILAAKQFQKQIYGDILFRKQDELDKLKQGIAELEKNFVKEKTEFDRYTQYIHKRQEFQRRWNKSFIQIYLDERGELYISSNYYGEEWLNHTGIRVYDGDLQSKTETIEVGTALNHQSDFMNTKWEKVSYMDGKDNGVIEFIATHADRNLKAVFLGKRYYYIILESYDKQAVIDALSLSKALKRQAALQQEIKSLQTKAG